MDYLIFAIANFILFVTMFALPEKAYRTHRKRISTLASGLYLTYTIMLPLAVIAFAYLRQFDEAALLISLYFFSLLGTGTREIYRDTIEGFKNRVVRTYSWVYVDASAKKKWQDDASADW
jgi:hypothetical protein